MSHELGDFLRARRTDPALSPLAAGSRRRITGLRREEVASAAGISVDYYTRLEQGREHHPSDAVLDALAGVLRLTPDARAHAARLREPRPAHSSESVTGGESETAETLAERLAALVAAVRPNPAYVLDRLSNMVAANPEGLAMFDGFSGVTPAERNTCRYLLLDPRARTVFAEWEELARGAVAQLRAANADDLRAPALVDFVAELSEASDQFALWWGEHIVERRRASTTHVRTGGELRPRRYEVLHLPEDGLRMTLWLPAA